MNLTQSELSLLAELLTGNMREEIFKGQPQLQTARDALIQKGLAEYSNLDWQKNPTKIKLLGVTTKGRAAYSAWANRKSDQEDTKSDATPEAGHIVRMATHIKEAGMIAYRLGYYGAKAKAVAADVNEKIYTREELQVTMERALGKMADSEIITALMKYLENQIGQGIMAANK